MKKCCLINLKKIVKRIDNLGMKVIDQNEEIDGMKNEMDRKDSNMSISSCGSLAI